MKGASYESICHDRRYEVDSRGIAEFGSDRVLRRFIPWWAVSRIEFEHKQQYRKVRWSVRAADGSRITPKLEYASSLECYNDTVRAWREIMPQACRMHFARIYRNFRLAAAMFHLCWLIPLVLIYALFGLCYILHLELPYEAVGSVSACSAFAFAVCLSHNLLYMKELRLGFDRWYALVEASFTEPRCDPPVSSSAILRWLFPALPDSANEAITELERRVYRRWDAWSVLPIVLILVGLCYAWLLGLTWVASLFHRDAHGTQFSLRPSTNYCVVPALFIGMITAPIPILGLYRALLGDRYRRYERYSMEPMGFNPRRLFLCFAVIVFAGSAVFFLAGVSSVTRFTDTGIEIQRPLSFRSAFYEYNRVRSIEHRATARAPIGTTVKRAHHVILFDDGTSWSTRDGLRDPEPDVDSEIARLVSQRSKRRIIEQP